MHPIEEEEEEVTQATREDEPEAVEEAKAAETRRVVRATRRAVLSESQRTGRNREELVA